MAPQIIALAERTLLRLPDANEEPVPALFQHTDFESDSEEIADFALLNFNQLPEFAPNPLGEDAASEAAGQESRLPADASVTGRRIVPIDPAAWESLPPSCLMRTLEFESIRQEYRQTFGQPPGAERFAGAPRLSLEDLLEIALLNSRQYQTQKELLYRAALRLSQQRYEYQLKFSPVGNGVGVNWSHRNDMGITENSLGVSTGAAVEKILATGGDFLARFANSVILTFNGPAGFASDISSELLAEITQPLLQRDIVFENLTQAERDVVYAARSFARFRKEFFRDIATDYYRLLLTYRSIEIDMLDFFSNQRGFDQAKQEYGLVQKLPRFQVDQFEQNALGSRSRVIGTCNELEQSFDQLKLRLGIPPETPINLDLTELRLLTARDEITVAAELARRASRTLELEVQSRPATPMRSADRVQVVNAAVQLAQKLQELFRLRQQQAGADETQLESLRAITVLFNKLQVEATVLKVSESRERLRQEVEGPRPPNASELYFPRMNLIEALLELGELQTLAYGAGPDEQLRQLSERRDQLSRDLDAVYQNDSESDADQDPTNAESIRIRNEKLAKVAAISERTGALLIDVEAVVKTEERLDATGLIRDVLQLGAEVLTVDVGGLAPIELDADEAMLTALVSRFDLMNQRGALADTWRQIKLSGDDLRSVLNLRASQTIRTEAAVNQPFDFTFDDSETRLSLEFDAPLNRRAQRNTYRVSLINYNAALRSLIQLEDDIKFSIRNNLRNLQLDREQYEIAVAGAALASDRRLSTRKQLDENLGNITARDFLEAQQAYTASLNGVASAHIGYLVDRIDLFLDLELLQVNDLGFWNQLYDEKAQPETRIQPPAGSGPAYGRLPSHVHYSDRIRSMECIPFGMPGIFEPAGSSNDLPDSDNRIGDDDQRP